MRVVVISKDNTDYARHVESFMTDFARQTGRTLEMIDPDTAEGESLCRTYDIVQYPTVVALSDSGQMQNIWNGEPLPTISEVSYYASQR
jgi:protein-disulfide isomerase-like protein with CxxC motif